MADGDELKIKLIMDRTDAEQATQQQMEDEKKIVDASGESAKARKASMADVAKSMLATDQATVQSALASDKSRHQSAQGVANAQQSFGSQVAASMYRSGQAGADAFGKMLAKVELTKVGFSALKDIALAFGSAIDQAAEKAKKLADAFANQRDKLGELATVMGEKPDNAFTMKQAQFEINTGFKPEEALAYRLEFQNSGAQYKGKNISDNEYNQYEEQAGQLAAAKNFAPQQVGDLAGTLLGFKDRKKLGANASEDALGKVNSGLSILGRGKGQNNVLINQFSMLASATLSDDSMKGIFSDSDEVATVVSAMAEKHDASAAEGARAAIKGLRGFDKEKSAPLLKKAGINPQTKFIDAIKQLTPIVEADAKARGVKVQDILAESFEDQLTAEALSTLINRGVSGGVFEDRQDFAKQNQGPKPALDSIRDYKASERGRNRIADARINMAKMGRGEEFSEIDIARKEAMADLIQNKEIDTTSTEIQDYLANKTGFSALGMGERSRVDNKVEQKLTAKFPELLHGRVRTDMPMAIEETNAMFKRQFDEVRSAGGNPTDAFSSPTGEQAPADPATVAKKLDVLIAETQKTNQLLKPQAKSPEPTPSLPSIVKPGPRQDLTR